MVEPKEVHFAPETESKLLRLAQATGGGPSRLRRRPWRVSFKKTRRSWQG
jgi:hypothetical protein